MSDLLNIKYGNNTFGITLDEELSATSENGVQNKAIALKVNQLASSIIGVQDDVTMLTQDVADFRDSIAPVAVSPTEQNYASGELLIYENALYRATEDIAEGDLLETEGDDANIEATTVADNLGGTGDCTEYGLQWNETTASLELTKDGAVESSEEITGFQKTLTAGDNIKIENGVISAESAPGATITMSYDAETDRLKMGDDELSIKPNALYRVVAESQIAATWEDTVKSLYSAFNGLSFAEKLKCCIWFEAWSTVLRIFEPTKGGFTCIYLVEGADKIGGLGLVLETGDAYQIYNGTTRNLAPQAINQAYVFRLVVVD